MEGGSHRGSDKKQKTIATSRFLKVLITRGGVISGDFPLPHVAANKELLPDILFPRKFIWGKEERYFLVSGISPRTQHLLWARDYSEVFKSSFVKFINLNKNVRHRKAGNGMHRDLKRK